VAVLKQVNNPDNGDNIPPSAPGYLQFFKQGSSVLNGFQVDSEGNINTAGAVTASGFSTLAGGAGTIIVQGQVSGDSNPRFTIGADGKIQWGGGAGALDTDLYRYAADGLATDAVLKLAAAATLLLGAAGDTNLYREAGGPILATDNSLALNTAGAGLQVKEGSNARMGLSTLVGGTVVVANTSVTANTRVFLTAQTSGASPGALRVSARTAGTSFTITSTSGSDTSTVAWLLVEPA